MPRADRTRARKKIKLPTGDEIYIPVLVKLKVSDQNGQETEISIDSTSKNSTRQVHVDQLRATPNLVGVIEVERIDSWQGLDIISQAQDSEFFIDNKTGADTMPPSFTTHQKTHVYRYYKDPNLQDNSGVWIDSELIDEISVIDQNGQEHVYFLDNPFNGDSDGQANPDDPDISGGGIDPPYRTDPFQNLVNWHATPGVTLRWTYTVDGVTIPLPGAGTLGPLSIPVSGPFTLATQYVTSMSVTLSGPPEPPTGISISGAPSVSPTSFSIGDWKDIAPSGVTPGLTLGTSASLSVLAGPPINDMGAGYYGDPAISPTTGLLAHGITRGGVDTVGTVSINASGVSVAGFVRTYAEISSGGGGFTITLEFNPP